MFRFAGFLLAMVAFFSLGGAAAAESLSPRAFTEAFATAATAAMPTAQVAVAGDLHLETRGVTSGAVTTDLHNAYQVYLRDPEHLDAIIKRYVALLIETVGLKGAPQPLDRSHIVPVLKTTGWVQALQRQRKSEPAAQLLTDPFNNELSIVYAEDLPSSIRFLMTRDDVGDRSTLRQRALANLHRLLKKIEMRAGANGVFLITAGGEYEASLLLADGIWTSGEIKVDGDIVAAVPAKDALIITGSHNAAGLALLHRLGADLAKGPYALTPALFVYRGGKWVTFEDK